MDRYPRGPSASARPVTVLIMVASVLVGATACSRDNGSATPAATLATAAASPTSTTTVKQVEQEVIAAYREAERVLYELTTQSGSQLDHLATTRTGASLENVRKGLQDLRRKGLVARYDNGFPRAVILSVTAVGDRAELDSCIVDDALIVHESNDSIYNNDVTTFRNAVVLVRQAGTWKVKEEKTIDKREGRVPCGEVGR